MAWFNISWTPLSSVWLSRYSLSPEMRQEAEAGYHKKSWKGDAIEGAQDSAKGQHNARNDA